MNNLARAEVVLPCTENEFNNFISSLLGKPQVITGVVEGPFEITTDNILNTHSLLMQRINQQNNAHLIQFNANIQYNDNSSVMLNSVDEFSSYREVKPLISHTLHISWVFMIQFNGKKVPEKQQIDISFFSSPETRYIDDTPIRIVGRIKGAIHFRISHTARSWASDIDSLLTNDLKRLTRDQSTVRSWIAKHSGTIGLSVFGLLTTAIVFGTMLGMALFSEAKKNEVSKVMSSDNSQQLYTEQINYLLQTVAQGQWERALLIAIGVFIIGFWASIACGVWAGSTADNTAPSFVLLTPESIKQKTKVLTQKRNKLISFIASVIVALTLGIAGNIFYAIWFARLVTN